MYCALHKPMTNVLYVQSFGCLRTRFRFEAFGLSFDLDFVVKTWDIEEGEGEEADLWRDRGNLAASSLLCSLLSID
jgi:hypothetical protein